MPMGQEFEEMTEDILCHPQFQALRSFCHHGGENSLYDHLVDSAKCAYRLAAAFGLSQERVRAVTRAALLHDFFGYDWRDESHKQMVRQYTGWKRLKQMHAFSHGAYAAKRASLYFTLDDRQRGAIRSHMFPLAPVPRSSEAWIVTLADKMVASREMSAAVRWHVRQLYHRARLSVAHS